MIYYKVNPINANKYISRHVATNMYFYPCIVENIIIVQHGYDKLSQ